MKNNKKLKVIIAIVIILIIIIGVVFGIVLNNSSLYIENGNYKIAKVMKNNDMYEYKNNWKFDSADLNGVFVIKYNPEKHLLIASNQLGSNQYGDILKEFEDEFKEKTIKGDFILNEEKNGILTYQNGCIPFFNKEDDTFGVINNKLGIEYIFKEGEKVIDINNNTSYLEPAMQIFLIRDASEKDKSELEKILKNNPKIKKNEFVSKEEATNIMKERFKDRINSLDNVSFSESYVVYFNNENDLKSERDKIINMDLSYVKKITDKTQTLSNPVAKILLETFVNDYVIKDKNGMYYFATNDITNISTGKIMDLEYLDEKYLDIYVARSSNKELQGYIVQKQNGKYSFLDKYREAVTKEYKFMNFVEVNYENYIVCSNSNIKTEEDIKNANFEVFDLKGNLMKINADILNVRGLLKLKQTNYSDKNSLEYILFK